jgi:site-specific recombinase XerD
MEAFLRERLPIELGASINTCDSYAHAFRLHLQYASECLKVRPSELQLEQLDVPLILDLYPETARRNDQSSRNTRLAAIKSFMHFMEYRAPSALEQIRRVLAIPAKKAEARLVRHLSLDELQSILDAPLPSEPNAARDRAIASHL